MFRYSVAAFFEVNALFLIPANRVRRALRVRRCTKGVQAETPYDGRKVSYRLVHPAGTGARLHEKPAKKSNPQQNVTNELRNIIAAVVVAFSPQQEENLH